MKTHSLFALRMSAAAAAVLLFAAAVPRAQEPAPPPAPGLPEGIQWETNDSDPLIGDPAALRGGTLRTWMQSYPLTFRLVGPNSNDAFAAWNRMSTMDFGLVRLHPVTDRFIPCIATHWSVQPDHKTIYYKLDPDARWSDGRPITADDFVFTLEMMRSEHIVDPFYNAYAKEIFESAEAIDKHTLKITGTRPNWRPLYDYNLWPTPRHATNLGPGWVEETNTKFQVVAGPYAVTEAVAGERVALTRVADWWGDGKRYFKGLYNVDRIDIRVINDPDRAFDFFKKGEIDFYQVGIAKRWIEEMNFEAIQKGWAHKRRVFVEMPEGIHGLAMNLQTPIFQNRDFRKAMQYLFDFDTLNEKIMYGQYFRAVSAFEGTPFAAPDLQPYGFDPRKAREHLQKAGFTSRGKDGILVNARGERAAFSLTYGSKTLTPHLSVLKEIYRRAGVEIELRLLEGATAFNRLLERKYEMAYAAYATSLFPDPHQYFASKFVESTNNNNIWGFGSKETDELIDIYRFDLDEQKRLDAMWRLDRILREEAFYIPFWKAPYVRFVYWDSIQFPAFYIPRRSESLLDWHTWWIDPARRERLERAMKSGQALEPDSVVDVDPWGVKAKLEAGNAATPATLPAAPPAAPGGPTPVPAP